MNRCRQNKKTSSARLMAGGTALILALSLGPAALAHDMWIAPSAFRPAPDEPVRLYLKLGEAGGEAETILRDASRIERFAVSGPGGTQDVPGVDGSKLGGVVRPQVGGRHAVVYVTRPAFIELAPKAFEDYLLEEGLDAIVEQRRELRESEFPGRELYSRSLKALIDVGNPAAPDSAVGLPLELLLEEPAQDRKRGNATAKGVRLTFDGEPLAGALVRARRLDQAGAAVTRRTDRTGRAGFDFGPGQWVVSAVTMLRSEEPRADWRSYWSSLTFEIRRDSLDRP